jgi:hypothetical protein
MVAGMVGTMVLIWMVTLWRGMVGTMVLIWMVTLWRGMVGTMVTLWRGMVGPMVMFWRGTVAMLGRGLGETLWSGTVDYRAFILRLVSR